MLLAFSEQAKGQKFPENASDQEMLEIVMGRWTLRFCWLDAMALLLSIEETCIQHKNKFAVSLHVTFDIVLWTFSFAAESFIVETFFYFDLRALISFPIIYGGSYL